MMSTNLAGGGDECVCVCVCFHVGPTVLYWIVLDNIVDNIPSNLSSFFFVFVYFAPGSLLNFVRLMRS